MKINSAVCRVFILRSVEGYSGVSERQLDARLLGSSVRLRLKCDGTRAVTRFRLSAKRTSPFKSAVRQFSRLLSAEMCASAVVMLDTHM